MHFSSSLLNSIERFLGLVFLICFIKCFFVIQAAWSAHHLNFRCTHNLNVGLKFPPPLLSKFKRSLVSTLERFFKILQTRFLPREGDSRKFFEEAWGPMKLLHPWIWWLKQHHLLQKTDHICLSLYNIMWAMSTFIMGLYFITKWIESNAEIK